MQTQLRRSGALPRLLVVLAALLALGQFQGGSAGSAHGHELVAGPVTPASVSPARLVRHLPNPWSPVHLGVWIAGAAVLLLLPCVGVAAWSPSRRTRQAYLLPFAGRGPPVSS